MGLGQFLESYFKGQQEKVKEEIECDFIEKYKQILHDQVKLQKEFASKKLEFRYTIYQLRNFWYLFDIFA
jgi:hypothetical protein